jgi:hypothetical protein
MRATPPKMSHFGPQRSVTQPVSGASNPPSSLPIPDTTEVTARVSPRSSEMGLKRAESP